MKKRLVKISIGIMALAVIISPVLAESDDAEWQLAFKDDFERSELGDDWDMFCERIESILDERDRV